MNRPVIVAIGYSRTKQLNRLLQALENAYYDNDDVTLIISIDYGGPREVLQLSENFQWSHGTKKVRTFSENQGLKKHILQCADYSMEYGSAIILEDDIVPSPYFYDYTIQALNFYQEDDRIFALSLYSQIWNGYANKTFMPCHDGNDAFISQIECSWGECFIGTRWREFKIWYEKNNEKLIFNREIPEVVYQWKQSRSKYVLYYLVENNKFFVTPYESLTTNCHESGTHVAVMSSAYQVPLLMGKRQFQFPEFEHAIKYDAFFESIGLKEQIEKEYGNKACIDYFGLHRNYEEYHYVLSTEVLPYHIIKTFGLKMKPFELNYLYNVPGEEIFLYDTSKKEKNRKKKSLHFMKVKYEVNDLSWQDALFYVLYGWWIKRKK